MTELTAALLPVDSPRYLMGVGSPEDLVESVARSIDMFDCVLPTRIARNGALFSRDGRINIYSAPHRARDEALEPGCDCYTCRTFSAAYVHHLFKAKELLVYRLATIHNLRFILRMMEEMREAIVAGVFEEYREDFHARFRPPDQRGAQGTAAEVADRPGQAGHVEVDLGDITCADVSYWLTGMESSRGSTCPIITCGTYWRGTPIWEKLHFPVTTSPKLQDVLAVRNDGDGNRAEMMRWGLVPSWAKDPKIGSRMINARGGDAHRKAQLPDSVQAAQVPDRGGQLLRMEARGQEPYSNENYAGVGRAVPPSQVYGRRGSARTVA